MAASAARRCADGTRSRTRSLAAVVALVLALPLVGFETVDHRLAGHRHRARGSPGSRSASARCSSARLAAVAARGARGCGAAPRRRRAARGSAATARTHALGRGRCWSLFAVGAAVPAVLVALSRRSRDHRADLHHARLGPQCRGRARRPARSRLCRVLCGRRLFLRADRALVRPDASGRRCRSRACSRRPSACCWDFRCCGCAATISPSSRLGFGEIVRIILLNWSPVTGGPNGIAGIPRPSFFGLPFAAARARRRRHLQPVLRHPVQPDAAHRLPLFRHPGAGAGHQPLHLAPAAAADRPRLGGAARGRDRLPRARHRSDQGQALGLRHRRDARRLRRRVLRDAPGLHQPGKLHLPGKRDHPRDRRAGRHGQPDGRRAGGDRAGDPARVRPRLRRVPHAALRRGDGGDHGVAAARPPGAARALDPPGAAGGGRRDGAARRSSI